MCQSVRIQFQSDIVKIEVGIVQPPNPFKSFAQCNAKPGLINAGSGVILRLGECLLFCLTG